MNVPIVEIMQYRVEYGIETVKMIRESFQRAMRLEQHNRFDDFNNHLAFFSRYDPKHMRVAIDKSTSTIVGCMVLMGQELDQLYVHTDYQRSGLGGRFIEIAKGDSPNGLELFTFQRNTQAQAFYKKHKFVEKARGKAPSKGNPWAENSEQLADIEFYWSPN